MPKRVQLKSTGGFPHKILTIGVHALCNAVLSVATDRLTALKCFFVLVFWLKSVIGHSEIMDQVHYDETVTAQLEHLECGAVLGGKIC